MDCSEMIVSEEIQDFIIEYNPSMAYFDEISEDVCFQMVNASWVIGYAKLSPQYNMNVSELGYKTIPKLYGLMDTTSMDDAGITATLNQPYLDLAGQGVIVGFIDTGIDYNMDIFKNSPVDSRIGVIWDQTINTPESDRSDFEREFRRQLGNDFQYGTIYTKETINQAITRASQGENPYDTVPSKDENGHGTFLAGIAAGGKTSDFTGAAPESEIAVVKLKPAKQYLRDFYLINDEAAAFQETDIMLGVSFLLRYAGIMKKPLVICIGAGTASGPRTGATPLANVLEYAGRLPNVVVVTCVGNEANQRMHTYGEAVSLEKPDIIEINVGDGEKGFVMEVWASTQDVLSVSVISPSGESIPRIPARTGSTNLFRFILEGTEVTVDYRVVESMSGREVIFIRFIRPTPGIWRVNVYSITNIEGLYNAWLPLRQFVTGDTYFLSASPYTTLLEPSANDWVITVGAYDHINQSAYIDSGRGYTALGLVKPDIVAPGVRVYGPVPGGNYSYKSGTSISAAHVAGASALLLTWGVYYGNMPFMGTGDVKHILIRGAERNVNETYPNRISGYGKMNLINSVIQWRVT